MLRRRQIQRIYLRIPCRSVYITLEYYIMYPFSLCVRELNLHQPFKKPDFCPQVDFISLLIIFGINFYSIMKNSLKFNLDS